MASRYYSFDKTQLKSIWKVCNHCESQCSAEKRKTNERIQHWNNVKQWADNILKVHNWAIWRWLYLCMAFDENLCSDCTAFKNTWMVLTIELCVGVRKWVITPTVYGHKHKHKQSTHYLQWNCENWNWFNFTIATGFVFVINLFGLLFIWLLFCGFIICARSFCSAILSAVNRFIVLSHLKQESQNDRWCMQKLELDFVFIFVLFCGKNIRTQNHCVHLHSYLWWIAKFNQRMVFGFCLSVFSFLGFHSPFTKHYRY